MHKNRKPRNDDDDDDDDDDHCPDWCVCVLITLGAAKLTVTSYTADEHDSRLLGSVLCTTREHKETVNGQLFATNFPEIKSAVLLLH